MRRWPVLMLPAIVLSAAAAGLAAAPTSAPDGPTPADAKFAALAPLCRKASQYRWSDAIVETFEKAPQKGDWQAMAGKISYKDGKLLLDAQPQGVGYMWRQMPAELRGQHGLRIEAWVQALPMNQPGMQGRFYQDALFLSDGKPQLYQGDYQYYFLTGQDGTAHQFNTFGFGQGDNAGAVKPGRLVHFTIECLGSEFRCKRDNSKLLKVATPGPPFRVSEQLHIGLMCYASRFALVQIAYRTLKPAPEATLTDEDWKPTGFAAQSALTEFLLREAVPRLDSPHYHTRQNATNLLAALLPLSRPAIEAGRATKMTAEGLSRLNSLAGQGGPVGDVPPVAVETKAPKTENLPFNDDQDNGDDKAGNDPTTQPEVIRRPAGRIGKIIN